VKIVHYEEDSNWGETVIRRGLVKEKRFPVRNRSVGENANGGETVCGKRAQIKTQRSARVDLEARWNHKKMRKSFERNQNNGNVDHYS
jgi:hypothetical protein